MNPHLIRQTLPHRHNPSTLVRNSGGKKGKWKMYLLLIFTNRTNKRTTSLLACFPLLCVHFHCAHHMHSDYHYSSHAACDVCFHMQRFEAVKAVETRVNLNTARNIRKQQQNDALRQKATGTCWRSGFAA